MRTLRSLFAIMLFASLMACDQKETRIPESSPSVVEGRPAPEITVSLLNGGSLKLSELRGNVVLLNFWTTWCPPCREEIPSLMKLNAAMKGKPYRMLAVSMDEGGKPAIEKFFRVSGHQLPAYTDPDGKAAATYGVTGFPETFVIDKNGIIIRKVIGPLDWGAPEMLTFLEDLMK